MKHNGGTLDGVLSNADLSSSSERICCYDNNAIIIAIVSMITSVVIDIILILGFGRNGTCVLKWQAPSFKERVERKVRTTSIQKIRQF